MQYSRFIYALYSHAKGLQHPWHSSCANLQLSVRRLILLKKTRLLQKNGCFSDNVKSLLEICGFINRNLLIERLK